MDMVHPLRRTTFIRWKQSPKDVPSQSSFEKNAGIYMHSIWVNYINLAATSLEMMVNTGHHLLFFGLIQVSELF